jgi:hypothetical protein
MRMTLLVLGLLMTTTGLASAQPPSPQASASLAGAERGGGEWDLFVSKEDGFKVDFPGAPKVTEAQWKTEQGYVLPSRIYSVERGRERYSLTVVDYNGIEQMGIARNKACPSGADQATPYRTFEPR